MHDQHVDGTINEVRGKVKEGVGDLTGNENLKAEGQADQLTGKVQQTVGDVQDTIKGVGDTIKQAIDSKS